MQRLAHPFQCIVIKAKLAELGGELLLQNLVGSGGAGLLGDLLQHRILAGGRAARGRFTATEINAATLTNRPPLRTFG